MKRKWAPPPEENPETRLAGSGKDPENNQARAAKTRTWSHTAARVIPHVDCFFDYRKARIAPPSPQKKPPPLPGSSLPSRNQPSKAPGSVRPLFTAFLSVWRVRSQTWVRLPPPKAPQTRPHTLCTCHPPSVSHQTHRRFPRPPSHTPLPRPRTFDLKFQARNPKDTRVPAAVALAAERREHAQHQRLAVGEPVRAWHRMARTRGRCSRCRNRDRRRGQRRRRGAGRPDGAQTHSEQHRHPPRSFYRHSHRPQQPPSPSRTPTEQLTIPEPKSFSLRLTSGRVKRDCHIRLWSYGRAGRGPYARRSSARV
jgi:hypothetical protein